METLTPKNGAQRHKETCACPFCRNRRIREERQATGQDVSLTQRESRFARNVSAQIASTGKVDFKSAALSAGYRESVAKDAGRNLIGRPDVQDRIENVLAKAGITPESLARHAKAGLSAKETKLAAWEGKFTDERQVPDNATRFRYFEATSKMLGMYPQEDFQPLAQLIVRLPETVLTPGHAELCTCQSCCDNWEARAQAMVTSGPTEPNVTE